MGEVQLAALLCAFLAGSDDEVRHYFDVYDTKRYVRVDCETPDHVIEVGMDGTSSARDSVHQALFYAHLTGKTPVVLMIDQDGFEGRFEYEMRHVTEMANVGYARCSKGAILRWVESSPMRASVWARSVFHGSRPLGIFLLVRLLIIMRPPTMPKGSGLPARQVADGCGRSDQGSPSCAARRQIPGPVADPAQSADTLHHGNSCFGN